MTGHEKGPTAELRDLDGAPLGDLPAPEPVPDLGAYLRERESCLSRSRERARNYQAYLRSARRSPQVDYLPLRLDFENVSRCNFRCTMCTVSEWHKGKRADDMPVDAFKRILDEQYGLLEIKVQGLGEPTLQGDDYFEMIRYARAKGIWVRTTTNASLLHLKNNYRKLIDSGVNEVQISIDGADRTTFESIRRQSDFARVTSNCKLINSYCAELGIERTKMWTVVQQANRSQLLSLVELAHELGFRTLAFSINMNDWGTERWRKINDAVSVQHSFTRAEAERLMQRGRELGIKITFWNVTDKYSTESIGQLCPWPFERAYVSSDLRVVPCCIIANPEVSEIGAIRDDFTSVWQGESMARFREAHLKGAIPAECRFCYKTPTTPRPA